MRVVLEVIALSALIASSVILICHLVSAIRNGREPLDW